MKGSHIPVALAALLSSSVVAYCDEPILLKEPYPAGLIPPKPLPKSILGIGSNRVNAPILCFFFDVGKDGHVSNIQILQSTGQQSVDDKIVAWWREKIYIPATSNGEPVSVRNIGRYTLGPPPFKDNCTWDFYESMRPESDKIMTAPSEK